MSNLIIEHSPSKVLRFGLRLPIWLYRLKLGWLLGERFLLLTHIGRKSRQPHSTVIEVVQHDKGTDIYYVVSGWGEKADWYQNIKKNPLVTIAVSGQSFPARAQFVPRTRAIEIMENYITNHPLAFRELSSLFLGERLMAGAKAAQRLTEKMPMVAFEPIHVP